MRTYFTKKNFFLIPELYFIVVFILYWQDQGMLFNPISIIFMGLIGYAVISKNKNLGLFIGIVLFLISGVLRLAYLSDYHKIVEIDTQVENFIFYGSLLTLSSILMSVLMIAKNVIFNEGFVKPRVTAVN